MSLLELRSLTVLRGGCPVVDGVSLRIGPGECVGLIGPNGAGKTTLMRAALGLERAQGWSSLAALGPVERARRAAFLPQARQIAWPVSVEALVGLGRLPHGGAGRGGGGWRPGGRAVPDNGGAAVAASGAAPADAPRNAPDAPWPAGAVASALAADRSGAVATDALPRPAEVQPADPAATDNTAIDAALARMELQPFRHRIATRLSGGEQARVLIARALAQDTPLLLADEPIAGLDPAHQLASMEVFAALAAEGRAVLVALHDLALAARFCTRLLMMEAGRLVADGPPEAVLSEANLARVFQIRAFRGQDPAGPVVQPVERLRRGPRP